MKQWEQTQKSHQVFLDIVRLFRNVNMSLFSLKSPSLTQRAEVHCRPSGSLNLGSVVRTCAHVNFGQHPTPRDTVNGRRGLGINGKNVPLRLQHRTESSTCSRPRATLRRG